MTTTPRRKRFSVMTSCLFTICALSAHADTITNVAVGTNLGVGATVNYYDSITGLQQTHTTGFNPTASVGPLAASVGLGPAGNEGTAAASASVAQGAVHILGQGGSAFFPAFASAMFQDSITFQNDTGHTVDLDVFWSFDGVIDSTLHRDDFFSYFCFGDSTCQARNAGGNGGTVPQPASADAFNVQYSANTLFQFLPSAGWVSTSATYSPTQPGGTLPAGPDNVLIQFHGVFAVPTGTSTDFIYGQLGVDCAVGCDFLNTGQLSFGPLDGLTFTSGTGALLTAPSAVPEPATSTLLLGGLAMIVVGKIRRR